MITASISINLEELAQQVPSHKIVKAYGESNILGNFTVFEIVSRFDADSLLEAIGEERIRDFLSQSSKKEIA